ncbi:hypothetical protein ACFL96_01045 [Thermoproteota archaeon]
MKAFWTICLGLALFLTGCTAGKIDMPADFWEKPSDIVLVWKSEKETGLFYQEAGLGALLANYLFMNDVIKNIEKVEIAPVAKKHYSEDYSKGVSEKGSKAYAIKLPLKKEKLKKNVKNNFDRSKKSFEYDVSEFKNKQGADYVFFLDIDRFGIIQESYYAGYPARPDGFTEMTIYLIDTETNYVVSQFSTSAHIDVDGNLFSEEAKEELVEAASESLIKGLTKAYKHFFEI